MLFLILLLLISIPLVSPSYHIPKLGRYHTFLRIGKRQFNEPCIEPSLCQPSLSIVSFVFFSLIILVFFLLKELKRNVFDIFIEIFVGYKSMMNKQRLPRNHRNIIIIVFHETILDHLACFLFFCCRQMSL